MVPMVPRLADSNPYIPNLSLYFFKENLSLTVGSQNSQNLRYSVDFMYTYHTNPTLEIKHTSYQNSKSAK